MKILIATDAWHPEVSDLIQTLAATTIHLEGKGHTVRIVTRSDFGKPMLSFRSLKATSRIFCDFQPDCVHIATEGLVGLMVRTHCRLNGIRFTTSYNTRPSDKDGWFDRAYLKWFHAKATKTLVPSYTLIPELDARGFRDLAVWNRGVELKGLKRHIRSSSWATPVIMYVGKVCSENNIEAFLSLKCSGTKLVMGDGPDLEKLKAKYPDVVFLEMKSGYDLAWQYSQANVTVFPSKKDTYNLAMLESLACGTPIAAYPEPGPLEILARDESARHCCFVDQDLQVAVDKAIEQGWSMNAIGVAREFTWDKCTDRFLHHLITHEQSGSWHSQGS